MADSTRRFGLDQLLIGLSVISTAVVVGLRLAHAGDGVVFGAACAALLAPAVVMGKATEEIAKRVGSTAGGLLNATFGNATELIVAVFALRAGLFAVVKASITGSIIGNVLVVLGFAALVGGLKKEKQTFGAVAASTHASMLLLAAIALVVPAIFMHATPAEVADDPEALKLGLWVAVVLIGVYGGAMVFSLKTHRSVFDGVEQHEAPAWGMPTAVGVLVGSTVLVAITSEVLVGALEPILEGGHLSPLFVGVIILPFVGNAAEHAGAVFLAARNKMDTAMQIAAGSSTQIALFVAPVLIFLSWIMGRPMTYIFEVSEIVAITAAVAVVNFISYDGETNWFEGVQLLGAYAIMALTFFFIPHG
jgi:Ca2+:H+ antiporter